MTARFTRLGLGALALCALVAAAPAAVQALQGDEAPRLDAAVLDALARTAPGTYGVRRGRIEAIAAGARAPVFVQVDALRRASGGIDVPLAVASRIDRPWRLLVRVTRSGDRRGERPLADVSMTGRPGTIREIRELALAPGSYQAVVVLASATPDDRWTATVARQDVAVPDVWSARLTASPVVLGESVETAPDGRPNRPFTFGPTVLTPAASNRFRQGDRLHAALRIFGWDGGRDAEPDVSVEYVFSQQFDGKFRFFNKTRSQALNARTLGDAFDGSGGSVTAGMTVPLVSFPSGTFELTVRVTDNRTHLSTSQKARFVVGS